MKKSLLFIVAAFQIINVIAQTQPISAKQIDSLTALVLKTFNVPGIAVGVVKNGKLIHSKGYGVSNLNTGKKIEEPTIAERAEMAIRHLKMAIDV